VSGVSGVSGQYKIKFFNFKEFVLKVKNYIITRYNNTIRFRIEQDGE
tara:strand:- start:1802 stop:1942 length:141 start_codon:yes stop_codon:yes gene_type:complete